MIFFTHEGYWLRSSEHGETGGLRGFARSAIGEGSGYGREMAELGLDEFVNKKLIRISELSDPF